MQPLPPACLPACGVDASRISARRVLWFGLFVSIMVTQNASVADASNLVVQTKSGAVQGVNVGSVNQWRGIPYAAPPVGNLRWKPPSPLAPWAGVRDGSEFGSHCIQLDTNTTTIGSEDCLFLNVSVPVGTTSASSLPVMVHVHGGGNTFGWGYEDAHVFTDLGVVVVTLNYRLGILGFLAHPALTAEGGGSSSNYALRDQIAALQWVQDNIAAFGGDPANVTLFGFSAGAFDVASLMVSPLAQGLFKRVALNPEAFWPLTGAGLGLSDVELIGEQLAQSVGCGDALDALTCLRATPADQLVLTFGFSEIDGVTDGKVLPKPVIELMQEIGGTMPMLLGGAREEWSEFLVGFVPNPMSWDQYVLFSNNLVGEHFGAKARALYPTSSYESIYWTFVRLGTDAIYACPVRTLALFNRYPTYRFLSTHVMENDPSEAAFKASHTSVDLLLWGATGIWNYYTETPAEQALSLRMERYWTNFAKTGSPNKGGLPLWPQYEPNDPELLILDDVSYANPGDYHAIQCNYLNTVPFILPPKCDVLCRARAIPFPPH
jgi:para-nitrobenzyl esterase